MPSFKHQGEIQRLAETTWVIQRSTGLKGIVFVFASLHLLLLPRFVLCAVPVHPPPPTRIQELSTAPAKGPVVLE